jgi:hypothetical protein
MKRGSGELIKDFPLPHQVYYQDKLKRTVTRSPYVDIFISPVLQFRVSIPIVRNTYPNNDKQIAAGANVQYNLKFSNLAQ